MTEEAVVEDGVKDNNEPEKLTAEEWQAKFNEGGWRESLPEDLATSPSLEKFNQKGYDEVVKSYLQLEKGFGDKIPKPKGEYTKEEWDSWRKEFMPSSIYPASEEDFDIGKLEDQGDYPYDEDAEKFFRKVAYEAGLTKHQAETLWKQHHTKSLDAYETAMKAQKDFREKDQAALKKEWGQAYNDKMALARNVIQKFGNENLVKALDGADSNTWKFLAAIGENFAEDTLPKSKAQRALTPKEAKAKANKYMQENKSALLDKMHKDHQHVLERWRELIAQATPEE